MKIRSRILLIIAATSLTLAAASPANAACLAASPTAQSGPSASVVVTGADGTVSPLAIQWHLFETNIGNEAKCESLLRKMKAAYPASYHWDCQPYNTSTCPPQERWELWFGENNV